MANAGFRIYTKIERPPLELVEGFRDIPVANIADNMGRISSVDTFIKPYNDVKLVGTAFTVKAPMGDNLLLHRALDMAQPGDVIVVDGEANMNHSLCGEIMMTYAIKKGIVGFVIDGCIRDVAAIKSMNFSVYARGVNPNGPYKNGPGEINVPITCGGQVVFPGDIIVGDSDGLVIIRPDDASAILEKAKAQNLVETNAFGKIEDGTFERTWIEKSLIDKGCEVIDRFYKD